MLQKCPKPGCRAKRLQPEKPSEAPRELIGKEALKIIESPEGVGDTPNADEKNKEEIKNLREQMATAKRFGWSQIQEMCEKQLSKLLPAPNHDIETAKDTKTVVTDRVKVLHNHEARCKALELKCENATSNIEKHSKAKIEALRAEKERHEKRLRAIEEDFSRMTKAEEDVIKEAQESLKVQREKFEDADDK